MTTSLMPPAGDISVHLLNMVLGSGWTGWFSSAGAGGMYASSSVPVLNMTATTSNVVSLINMAAGSGGSVIGDLMTALSGMLLLIGAAVIVYTYGTGAANAAHTGDHKLQPMWTPLRQAYGIAALAPLPLASGISVIMAIISFPVLLGIGLADNLATVGVKALVTTGGQVAPANPPAIDVNAVDALFTNLVVSQYLSSLSVNGTPVWKQKIVSTWSPDNTALTVTTNVTSTDAFGATLPASALGITTLDCPATAAAGLCGPGGAAEQGLLALVSALSPTAAQIVNATNGTTTTAAPTTTATPVAPAVGGVAGISSGAIQTAMQAYQTRLQAAMATYNRTQNTALSAKLNDVAAVVEAQGWASLPMFYYRISQFNDAAQGVGQGITLTVSSYNASQMVGATHAELDSAVTMAQNYEQTASVGAPIDITSSAVAGAAPGTSPPSSTAPGGQYSSSIMSALNPFRAVVKYIMSGLSSGTDPIANLQTGASWGIDAVTTSYLGGIAIAAEANGQCVTAKSADNAASKIPFVGWAVGLIASAVPGGVCGLSYAADKTVSLIGFLAIPVMAALMVGAFYLPMAPAIIMTLGVLNWVSLVVELFIASILWAFAHILPGGDDVINEHSREGYFMVMDVCLRPALMVFGYFLSIAMIAVAAYFVVTGLAIAFDSSAGGNVFGPISAVAELIILIGTLYAAINHSVGLIHRLPQTAMRMMGRASGMDLGEEQIENKVSGMAAANFSHGGSSMGQGGGALHKGVQESNAQKKGEAARKQATEAGNDDLAGKIAGALKVKPESSEGGANSTKMKDLSGSD